MDNVKVIEAVRAIQEFCSNRLSDNGDGCKECPLYDFCERLDSSYWPFDWEVKDL